ncbi:vitellogenin-like [Cetorhinus maximus]
MRGIIFALTFVLVGSQQYGPSFSHSKTYVYQYEGVVLTGLPENGLARGGLKITSKLQISSIDQRTYLLKIISPQIQEYSGTWPNAQFIPARKLTRKLSAQLSKPIEFEYNHGRVGSIWAHPDLPENILNIHRGILNMLQISIKKSQNIYELQENGVEGICQASYVIQENKKSGFITVIKSKDLNKCQEKISKTKGSVYSQPCETCQLKGKSLRSVATYSYAIKNIKDEAVIVEVVSRETHQFTPFNERDGAASTESRQHLVFLDCKNQSPPIPTEHLEKRGTLRYQFSNELLQIPLLLVKPSPNDTNKIITTLENLVQMNRERAHPDAPLKFLQLIQLLRLATLENLQSVWEKSALTSHHRRWIWDTLPTAGTPEAIQFIRTKIEQGELLGEEAAKALIFVLHSIKADCHGVDNATVLLSSPYMQRDPFLRRVTLLAYGTLVYKYCATLRVCPDEALQPLHKLVVEAGSGDSEEQTILGLKAIGNAGQVASLKRIQKLLPGFGNVASSVTSRIHGEAVMALRNIAKKEPRKVQAITLQLFMNKRINAELRMRAFIVLMETKPSLALIASVTDSLVRETNLQVTSFGYSYMKSLAGSSVPELQSLAASCNLAIKRLNQKCSTLSYRYSKGLHFGAFKDKLLAGIDANVYLIKKSEGILPTTAVANFKVYGLGVSSDFLEIGIHTEGQWKKSQPHQRTPRNEHIMRKVPEWKSIPIIKPQAVVYIRLFGQELAFAEFRQKDLQELKKGKIERLLKEFIEMLQSGLTVHWTKPWLASEIRYIVPTSLGLPLEIAFYYTVVSVVHAKVKVNVSSSNLTMAQLLNTSIQGDVQFTASSVKDVIAVMGISTPLVQAGVAAQLKTNTVTTVNFAAEVNFDNGNVKIETNSWKQEDQLFFARLWAFAFARNIEDLAAEKVTPLLPRGEFGIRSRELSLANNSTVDREGVMEKVLPLALPRGSLCSAEDTPDVPSPTVREICVKSSTFGVEICFKTSTENAAASATDSLLYKIVGDKSIEVTIRPVIAPIPIKKLQVELQLNGEDQLSARVSDLMRRSNRSELTLPEGKLTLLKFKKIFNGRRWNEHSTHPQGGSSSSMTQHSTTSSSSSSKSGEKDGARPCEGSSRKSSDLQSSSRSSSVQTSCKKGITQSPRRPTSTKKCKGGSCEKKQPKSPYRPKIRNSSLSSTASISRSSSISSSAQSDATYGGEDSERVSSISSSSSGSSSSRSGRSKRHHRKHHGQRHSSSSSRVNTSSSSTSWHDTAEPSTKRHTTTKICKNGKCIHEYSKSRTSTVRVNEGWRTWIFGSRSEEQEGANANIFQFHFKPSHYNLSQTKDRLSFESSSKSSSGSGISSSSSSSYSSSSSSSSQQSLSLEDSVPPIFVLLTRAILTDNEEKGYQTTAYMDSSLEQRALQVFVDELQEGGSWRACIGAEMPNVHRAVASLKWGKNCQDYKIAAKASTGHFEHHPAVLFKAQWDKIPQTLKEIAGIVTDKLAGIAFTLGFSERHKKSPAHQISVVAAATSQQTLNVVVKTPKHVFSRQGLHIPAPLPFNVNSPSVQKRGLLVFVDLPAMVSATFTAECTVVQNTFTPFTKDSFEYQMPEGCAHVLVQDCTPELKFIVLLRRSAESLFVQLNCPSSAIEMQSTKTGKIQLFVNGTKVSIASLPFTGPRSLVIERSENGVKIKALGIGLEKLFFDGKEVKVAVGPWMAESTCGLCGRSDSQRKTEYPQPNKRSTDEILKFAHSWLLPGENCTDACKLTKRTVRLNNTVNIHGQESKCYTVDPVLGCQARCSLLETAPVVYGFHCLPADSHANPSDEQLISANFGQKSEDLTGTVEAHTACSCPSECS